jgi:anaerobic magnesium-protoporphyrin IX monomethyl ester cyclase
MHTKIELGFDESRILSAEEMTRLKEAKLADVEFRGEVSACGGPAAAEPAAAAASGGAQQDMQVVIVEADEAARIALRRGLRAQAGIEVASEATNGTTGLVLLDSIVVDVVVVCNPLPDMDLAEFVQRARRQNPCQPVRLLVLSDAPADLPQDSDLALAHCPRRSSMGALAAAAQALMGRQRVPDARNAQPQDASPVAEPLAVG